MVSTFKSGYILFISACLPLKSISRDILIFVKNKDTIIPLKFCINCIETNFLKEKKNKWHSSFFNFPQNVLMTAGLKNSPQPKHSCFFLYACNCFHKAYLFLILHLDGCGGGSRLFKDCIKTYFLLKATMMLRDFLFNSIFD